LGVFMVKVGRIDGQDVEYDEQTYEFRVEISGQTFRAKSFPGLKRLVEKSKKLVFEKAMEIGWSPSTPPKAVEVTQRGTGLYVMADGKLHRADSYNLYKWDANVFRRLSEISAEVRKLEDEWNEIKGKLKRII